MGEGGGGRGEKRKEKSFSPSALSLFRFHFPPFSQKHLILRLGEMILGSLRNNDGDGYENVT